METAVAEIDDYLIGDTDARIECDDEGEMYKLFHSVNTLVSVLNAHIENEFRTKEFTILSEKELDRIESLIQNLLKITRLDAGTIILEKNFENVSDMMHDIEWTEKKFTRW